MNQDRSASLVGEVRLRVPLPLLIPLGALALIAVMTVLFARLLLSVPSKEVATALALVMAANVLGACAVVALRRDLDRSAWVELGMVVLYPVLVGIVMTQVGFGSAEHAAGATEPAAEAPAGPVTLVAQGTAFDKERITLPAGEQATIELDNQDSSAHNVAIYENAQQGAALENAIFDGEVIEGGESITYEFEAPPKGEYFFQCDLHPTAMTGTVVVE